MGDGPLTFVPLWAVFLAVTLTGCVSTDVTSRKVDGYDEEIANLHLATQMPASLQKVSRATLQQFQATLDGQGVPLDTSSLTLSETSTDSIEASPPGKDSVLFARAADASHVLLISTRSQETINKSYSGPGVRSVDEDDPVADLPMNASKDVYVFDASLYDTDTEERVWRGEITSEGDLTMADTRTGHEIVEVIIVELRAANLLPYTIKTAQERKAASSSGSQP